MPQLNNQKKAIIQVRLHELASIRQIANELGIDKNTVLLAKKKIRDYGTISRNPGSGRRRISNANQDNDLVNILRENPFHTVVRAVQETEFPGSLVTAQRRVRESELKNRCAAKKVWLTIENKEQRLQFALEFLNRQDDFWQNVIFSDEKSFQSAHNGSLKVYRPRNTRYEPRYTKKENRTGHFKVNVWCWISHRGPGICIIVNNRLNAEVYRRILDECLLPSVRPIFGENFLLQHDNCPIHRARIVREFIEQENIDVLPWCSKSPDLNPVENVWAKMEKFIRQHNFRPRNIDELQHKILEAWQEITPDFTAQLVSSMPRRLLNVIELNGETTKY